MAFRRYEDYCQRQWPWSWELGSHAGSGGRCPAVAAGMLAGGVDRAGVAAVQKGCRGREEGDRALPHTWGPISIQQSWGCSEASQLAV